MRDILFVGPTELITKRIVLPIGAYPTPFPGNINPTKKPSYDTLVLYQIMRGMNVNYSFKRMVKMMYDMGDVEQVVRKFVDLEASKPENSGYLNLAEAYAEVHGVKFDYKSVEFGHELRVWGKDNEEWKFDIRRGDYRIRKDYKRDYSKLLGVRKIDMLNFTKLNKSRGDLAKPFRRTKKTD